MRKQRGIAVILAIFIAMVAFTSAAVITVRMRHDLQATRLGARQVQRRMAVSGAVNHLLSMLRRGDGLQYTQASPLTLDIAGVEGVKVWSMPDASLSNVIHIRAELMGVFSTKALSSTPPLDSVLFFEDNDQLFNRKPNDVSWTPLPAHPTTVYDSTGTPSSLAIEIQDIETNHDGKLFIEAYQGAGWHQGVSMWDNELQSWSTVPPLQNFNFNGGSLNLTPGHQPIHLDGADKDSLYSFNNGGLAKFDIASQSWNYHMRPPGERGRFATAGSGKFVIQLQQTQSGGPSWLSVFEHGSWSIISITDNTMIPRGINEDGEIFIEHGTAIKKWENNSWQTVPTPPALSGHSLRAVDAEGAFIMATPAGDVARWDQDSNPEQYQIPPTTEFFQSDWRQFGGGGQVKPGALPALEVVSSY